MGQLQTAHCVHGKGIRFILDAFLASVGACNCQRSGVILTDFPECNEDPYVLVFEETFDGDSLDLAKWQESPHAQGALQGSQRLEYCTLRNITLRNGICSITAKKETVFAKAFSWMSDNELAEDGLPNLRVYNYTSGMMWSREKFLYGKYEVRCRMPKGNGFWPAFWMFGGEGYNEVDVFDSYAGTDELVTSMGHEFKKGTVEGCHDKKNGFDLSEWHTYSCELERDKISFFVDNKLVRTIYRVVTLSGDPVLCSSDIGVGTYFQLNSFVVEPMHIILDMFLISENGPGGSKPVDDSTPFPSSFEVDYVRFWNRRPAQVRLFPNPALETVNVYTTLRCNGLRIYDGVGNLVREDPSASQFFKVDLAGLSEGMYIVAVQLEGAIVRSKLLKLAE